MLLGKCLLLLTVSDDHLHFLTFGHLDKFTGGLLSFSLDPLIFRIPYLTEFLLVLRPEDPLALGYLNLQPSFLLSFPLFLLLQKLTFEM